MATARNKEMFALQKLQGCDRKLVHSLVFDPKVMERNMGRVFTPEEGDLYFEAMLARNAAAAPYGCFRVSMEGGDIGLAMVTEEEGALELEYMLLPQFWGRGLGTALVSQLIAAYPGENFTALTDPGNTASIRILQKNGFREESRFCNDAGEAVLRFVR